MSRVSRKKAKQNKIVITVTGLVLLAVLAGGFLMWRQLPDREERVTAVSTGNVESQSASETVEYQGETYRYKDHLSNYLFLGIDTRDETASYSSQHDAGQADSIFLVSMDRVSGEQKVLIIPRDTITRIQVFNPSGKSLGTTEDHINLQYAYGDGREESCELMETAVSALLGDIPIQNYCALNMDGIPLLTEMVGGVTVTVPDRSLEELDPVFAEGEQVTLNRDNTELFVRYRDITKPGSALVRQGRQKVYMKALAAKAQQKAAQDASFVVDLYESLEPYMVTNMGNDLFAKLLAASAGTDPEVETVPGEAVQGTAFDEYHVNQEELEALLMELFYEKSE